MRLKTKNALRNYLKNKFTFLTKARHSKQEHSEKNHFKNKFNFQHKKAEIHSNFLTESDSTQRRKTSETTTMLTRNTEIHYIFFLDEAPTRKYVQKRPATVN